MFILILNTVIAITLLAALIIPYTGDVRIDKAFKKGFTWRFWVIAALGLATYILTLMKDYVQEENQDQKDTQVADLHQKRLMANDSIAAVRNDSSIARIVREFSSAIGEYNLKVERSMDGVLQVVRDSAKKVINQSIDPEPTFGVCLQESQVRSDAITVGVRNDSLVFRMRFCCTNANAYDIDIRLVYLLPVGSDFHLRYTFTSIFDDPMMRRDSELAITQPREIDAMSDDSTVYILLYGTYRGLYQEKPSHYYSLTRIRVNGEGQIIMNNRENFRLRQYVAQALPEVRKFFAAAKLTY